MAEAVEVCGDWKAYLDKDTGNKYYANSVTNTTTWERPSEFDQQKKKKLPPPIPAFFAEKVKAKRSSTTADEHETLHETPHHAKPLSHPSTPNHATLSADIGPSHSKQSSISSAHELMPSDSPKVQGLRPNRFTSLASIEYVSPSGWKAHFDNASNRYYYHNANTKESSWDTPSDYKPEDGTALLEPDMRASPRSAVSAPAADQVIARSTKAHSVNPVEELPPGWVKHFDQASGKHYYQNTSTNQTQWEPPTSHKRVQSWAPGANANTPTPTMQSSLAPIPGKAESKTWSAERRKSGPQPPKELPKLPAPIRAEIERFQMSGFASEHFRVVKRRAGLMTKKVVPVEELISFQPDLIEKSLLANTKQFNHQAVAAFKCIMQFMGDLPSKKHVTRIASIIIETGQKFPQLRDEIFCQLCKQVTDNPSTSSVAQGWKLFAMCCSAFPPSRGFESFLRAFLAKNYDHPVREARQMAPYCYWRLEKTIAKGPKNPPHSIPEVEFLLTNGVPPHKVFFGGSLDYMVQLQQAQGYEQDVPIILLRLTKKIIELGGDKAKGMFRVAANRSETDQLKADVESGNLEIKCSSPHVAGDLLKVWLRDLQETLIPRHLYAKCMEIADKPDQILALCSHLSKGHYDTMDYLMKWLRDLAKHHAVTSMNEENLAIVFCQNILQRDTDGPADMAAAMTSLGNSEKEKLFIKNAMLHWPA